MKYVLLWIGVIDIIMAMLLAVVMAVVGFDGLGIGIMLGGFLVGLYNIYLAQQNE